MFVRLVQLASLAAIAAALPPYPKKIKHCAPTHSIESAGPVYRFGAQVKNSVCDATSPGNNASTLFRAEEKYCLGNNCLKRETVTPENGVRLLVQGRIKDTACRPLSNAVLDIWQTNAHGRYGSLQRSKEDGFCRAQVVTNRDGLFNFETEIPGAYGQLNGALGWIDLPPFAPQHIHVLVAEKGFKVFITQLYFPGDPARQHDWRVSGTKFDHGANESGLQLNISKCAPGGIAMNCAHFDIVMERDVSVGEQAVNDVKDQEDQPRPLWSSQSEREDAIRNATCFANSRLPASVRPYAICWPWVMTLTRWYVISPIGIILLAVGVGVTVGLWIVSRAIIRSLRSSRTATGLRMKAE